MFKDAKDYDQTLKGLFKSELRTQAAKKNLEKINSLPRKQKVWLDNLKGRYVGEKNPNYGKTHSVEARAKISIANKGRKHSEESKLKRKATMLSRYNKGAIAHPTHTFDNMSIRDFLNNNKNLILSLVDENHRYKYHKIHRLLIEKCTSNTEPSQNFRSVQLTNWMAKVDK